MGTREKSFEKLRKYCPVCMKFFDKKDKTCKDCRKELMGETLTRVDFAEHRFDSLDSAQTFAESYSGYACKNPDGENIHHLLGEPFWLLYLNLNDRVGQKGKTKVIENGVVKELRALRVFLGYD